MQEPQYLIQTRLEWAAMAHYHHVATDGTCHVRQHPLCPFCNPDVLEGDPSWHDLPAPTAEAPESITTTTSAGLVEEPAIEEAVSQLVASSP